MRLLFVLSSLHRGGAERHTIDLAAALAARGHACHLVTIKGDVKGGLRVPVSSGVGHAACEGRGFADRRALDALRLQVRQFAPDHVVCGSSYGLLYAWLALGAVRRAPRPQLSVVFHTTRLRTMKDQMLGVAYRRVYARADQLVYVCDDQRRYWSARGMGAGRVRVIHNGVDTEHFSPDGGRWRQATRRQLGIADDTLVIGITAAFRPEKNHGFLVQALARMRSAGMPVVLLMVGDGDLRPATEQAAAALGVSSACRFVGAHDDVRPFVAAFDVFVLASTHIETFPLSALEAMSMGVPAVLSDVGGVREMLQTGVNGYLYEAGDTDGFVDGIQRLLDTTTRESAGCAARSIVCDRFTHDRMVEAYEDALQG